MRTLVRIVSLSLLPAFAQAACILQHATRFGDSSFDRAQDSALDPDGRLVVTGSFFAGTLAFAGLDPLVNAGSEDVVLVVFDAGGAPVWAQSFGGSNSQVGLAVDCDASGNIVLAGFMLGTADFGGGPLNSPGYGIFLAKFDGNGNHIFSKLLTPTSFNIPTALAVAPDGDIVLLAEVSSLAGRIYYARLDSDGTLSHDEIYASLDFDERQSDSPGDIAVSDGGDAFITGSLGGVAQFDGFTTSSAGWTDAFVAKIDASGSVQWVSTWGGSQDEYARALVVAADGSAYFAGSFDSADAPGLSEPTVFLDDWFVACLNSDGGRQWVRNGGTARHDRIYGLALTSTTDVVLTGSVYGDTFDECFFLASYESDGTPRFDVSFPDAMGGIDRGHDVVVDANEAMIVSGSFEGTLDLCSELLTSDGEDDGFVIRLATPGPVAAQPAALRAALAQNRPNPFNPSTTLSYRLFAPGSPSIEIFDAAGRLVRRLSAGPQSAGEHSLQWDGRDEAGESLASGVYRYRLAGRLASEMRSMVLLR